MPRKIIRRKPASRRKSGHIMLRVTREEKARVTAAAKKAGRTVSEHVILEAGK